MRSNTSEATTAVVERDIYGRRSATLRTVDEPTASAIAAQASITIKEAGVLLGKSPRVIRDMIAKGELNAFQVSGKSRTGQVFRLPLPLDIVRADSPERSASHSSAVSPPPLTSAGSPATVSTNEAAILLGKAPKIVRQMIRNGQLRAWQIPAKTGTAYTYRIPLPLELLDPGAAALPNPHAAPTAVATLAPLRQPPTQDGLAGLVALSSQILEAVDLLEAEHQQHTQALEQIQTNTRRLVEQLSQFGSQYEQAETALTAFLRLK